MTRTILFTITALFATPTYAAPLLVLPTAQLVCDIDFEAADMACQFDVAGQPAAELLLDFSDGEDASEVCIGRFCAECYVVLDTPTTIAGCSISSPWGSCRGACTPTFCSGGCD